MKNSIWKLFTLLLLFSFVATPALAQVAPPEADRLVESQELLQGAETVPNSADNETDRYVDQLADPSLPQGEAGISSLTGSYVVFDPSVGGDEYYIPGTTQTLCFEAVSSSPDWDYAHNVWQKFPSNWVVTDVYVEGTPHCDSAGSFDDFDWEFHTAPYEVRINHARYHDSTGDTCYAHYCFEVTSAPAGQLAPVSWYWKSDYWGAPPFNPCSEDGYTPTGEPACDEMINPAASVPGAWILLEEGFEDEVFPPAGWTRYNFDGVSPEWARTTVWSNSGAASASHNWHATVAQDGWLVTPSIDIEPSTFFSFYDRGEWMGYYEYSGVWLSTGSCDPTDGDFVELIEVDDSTTSWRQVQLNLSAYEGESACLAFVYGGLDAHNWSIDDVLVLVEGVEAAVQVSPESLESEQKPDTQVTLPLEILNTGLGDLIWFIEDTPGFGGGPAVIYEPAPSIPAEVFIGTVPEGYQPQGVGEGSSPTGSWQTLDSAPFNAMDNVYIGYEGKGYQIGGYDGFGAIGQVGIYDANTDTWTTGADAPSPSIKYPVDGCFGFNAGGDPVGVLFNDTTSNVTTLHRYNITTDSWDTPPVPSGFPANGLWATAIASVHPYTGENVCYISGGATTPGGGNTSALYAYHPDTNTVENLGNFNYIDLGFAFHATWYVPWIGSEGGICVGGGVNAASVVTANTQCYDIGAGVFNAPNADLGAMPEDLWGMAAGILFEDGDYQLWVAQGSKTLDDLWPNSAYFSYNNTQWYNGPPPPRAGFRVGGTNIATDDGYSFYVVGGSSGGFTPTNGHERNFSPDNPFPPPEPTSVLYDNGTLVTHPGGGFEGADASVLQTALGMSFYGFGNQFSLGHRMADDFEVTHPGGWWIDDILFFSYQTGSPTDPSTITGLYYQIWDGAPDDPDSIIIWGDLITNRLVDSTWTHIYRVPDTAMSDTSRPIMVSTASAGLWLETGTYWLDWTTDGSLASGPWAPPITILGETTTGNAMHFTTAWAPALDSGTGTQQGMPFKLLGLTVCDVPGDVDWLSVSPDSGVTTPGEMDEVLVTFDSTGLDLGEYSAYLCVYSNDLVNPVVVVPVSLEVVNQPPVAEDQAVETDQDTPVEITLVATDPDGDALTYMIVDEPENGTLVYEAGDLPVLTYVPDEGWFGEDTFSFQANDGWADSNIGTVTITVQQVNEPPVAEDQVVETDQDTPVEITLVATDLDGDALTYMIVDEPDNGTLEYEAGDLPVLTYVPDAGWFGVDSFSFKANDGWEDSNIATVTITVFEVGFHIFLPLIIR